MLRFASVSHSLVKDRFSVLNGTVRTWLWNQSSQPYTICQYMSYIIIMFVALTGRQWCKIRTKLCELFRQHVIYIQEAGMKSFWSTHKGHVRSPQTIWVIGCSCWCCDHPGATVQYTGWLHSAVGAQIFQWSQWFCIFCCCPFLVIQAVRMIIQTCALFFVDSSAVSWKNCKADRHRLQFRLLCSNLLSSSEGLQHGDAWRWSPMKYDFLARGMWAIAMACVVWKVQRIQLTMLYWFVDLLCWWRMVDSHTNWQQVRSNYNQLQHEGFCSQSGEALTLGCACLRKERVQNIWCWSVGFWLHWMTQAKKVLVCMYW